MAREIIVTPENVRQAKRAKRRQSVTKRAIWSCDACGITGTDDVVKCPRCHGQVGDPPAAIWSDRDMKDYDQAKLIIADNAAAVVKVANAIQVIRDGQLWKIDHDSYQAFLDANFSIGERRGRQLMAAARAVSGLADTGNPISRLSTRSFTELDRVESKETRSRIVAAAFEATKPGSIPSSADIKARVDHELGVTRPDDGQAELFEKGPTHSLWQRIAKAIDAAKKLRKKDDDPRLSEVAEHLEKANKVAYIVYTEPLRRRPAESEPSL